MLIYRQRGHLRIGTIDLCQVERVIWVGDQSSTDPNRMQSPSTALDAPDARYDCTDAHLRRQQATSAGR